MAGSWTTIGPQVELVLAGHPSKSYKDLLIHIDRNGRVEETYWTYSFTPVRDDAGAIGGVLVISTDTTGQVSGARRQETLDWLRQRLAGIDTNEALHMTVASAREFNPGDFQAVATMSSAAPADFATSATKNRLRITSSDVGVDADIAVGFELSPKRPLDTAFRLFLEQFTLLVANACHRIDLQQRRRGMEAERDRLLLDAPVGAAVMVGDELVYHLVNSIDAMVSGRPADAIGRQTFCRRVPGA